MRISFVGAGVRRGCEGPAAVAEHRGAAVGRWQSCRASTTSRPGPRRFVASTRLGSGSLRSAPRGRRAVARLPRERITPGRRCPSKRALWDTTITELLAMSYEPGSDGRRPPESLYGTPEDVDSPAARGYPCCAMYRRAVDEGKRVVWHHKGEEDPHH